MTKKKIKYFFLQGSHGHYMSAKLMLRKLLGVGTKI